MKVFVVTKGCWSAYTVLGVASTREKADEEIAAMYRDVNEPLEVELDAIDDLVKKTYKQFAVLMSRKGESEWTAMSFFGSEGKPSDNEFKVVSGEVTFWDLNWDLGGVPHLFASVWAVDAEHAVKIVNEHRTQLIAENKW